jgi:uncharacterized protein (TIGR02569 family)
MTGRHRLDPDVAASFGVSADAVQLSGGEGRTFRCGNIVLRRESDPEEAAWIADLFSRIEANGFRIPRPVPAGGGGWMGPGGWSAWTYVEGRPATLAESRQVAQAVDAFHAALAHEPCPGHLARRDLPYDRADRWAWDDVPTEVDERLAEPLARLVALRRPLPDLRPQLIHGDLNPENVLIAAGLPPAIIDLAPYWRPAGFGAAVAAFWLGPYRDDAAVLDCFAHIEHLDQLLVRAGIRMLLSMQELGHLDRLADYRAAIEIVYRRAGG